MGTTLSKRIIAQVKAKSHFDSFMRRAHFGATTHSLEKRYRTCKPPATLICFEFEDKRMQRTLLCVLVNVRQVTGRQSIFLQSECEASFELRFVFTEMMSVLLSGVKRTRFCYLFLTYVYS